MIKKRFIAGAICPGCRAQDTLVVWRDNDVEYAQCVTCQHQFTPQTNKVSSPTASDKDLIIGVFRPQ